MARAIHGVVFSNEFSTRWSTSGATPGAFHEMLVGGGKTSCMGG
jgi:hypothetical protein